MFARVVDAGKRWTSPVFRKQDPVYQHYGHRQSTELRFLTSPSINSTATDVDTSYRPQSFASKATSPADRKFFRKNGFGGWRFGILHFSFWASVVFLINFIVTIVGSVRHGGQRGVLMEGDCDRVKKLNTGLHVLINILSTILLSGSNYCMQCLSSPTRREVDKAHANGLWLDIGVPSVRNIKHISRRRMILWSLFGLTSLPLHLFYNSAVFGSVSSNSYFAFTVSESFWEDDICRNCTNTIPEDMLYNQKLGFPNAAYPYTSREINNSSVPELLKQLHSEAREKKLEKLEPAKCIAEYGTSINSNRRNVLVVGDKLPPIEQNKFLPGSHVWWVADFLARDAQGAEQSASSYSWICSGRGTVNTEMCSSDIDNVKANPGNWTVGEWCHGFNEQCDAKYWPVKYCLSQKAVPHCRLQFSPGILTSVTVLNFLKAALMLFTALRIREEPLMTMGDAVASFLEDKDNTSRNMCLLSKHDIRQQGYDRGPKVFMDERYRWKDITSKVRRTTTLATILVALVIVSALLAWGILSIPGNSGLNFSGLARLGFGTVDPRTSIVGLKNDLAFNAFVANSPQVILSLIYFSYNAQFTAMLLGYEWASYSGKRKGLRVSRKPSGEQRSTYFLQLPYRFGTPLMILSGTLHWLVSQSIFLIAIDFYNEWGKPGDGPESSRVWDLKTCGYSPIAMIAVLILGGSMVIAIIGFGFIRYKPGMTLAGSCSLAISAACHVEGRDAFDANMLALKRLRWGVVSVSADGIGHCAFSTQAVEAPIKGVVYAGSPNKDESSRPSDTTRRHIRMECGDDDGR